MQTDGMHHNITLFLLKCCETHTNQQVFLHYRKSRCWKRRRCSRTPTRWHDQRRLSSWASWPDLEVNYSLMLVQLINFRGSYWGLQVGHPNALFKTITVLKHPVKFPTRWCDLKRLSYWVSRYISRVSLFWQLTTPAQIRTTVVELLHCN